MSGRFNFTTSSFDLNKQAKDAWEEKFIGTLQEIIDSFVEYKGLGNVNLKRDACPYIFEHGSVTTYVARGNDTTGEEQLLSVSVLPAAFIVVAFSKHYWKSSNIKTDASELADALLNNVECTGVVAYITETEVRYMSREHPRVSEDIADKFPGIRSIGNLGHFTKVYERLKPNRDKVLELTKLYGL